MRAGLLQTAEYARHRIAEMPALHKVPEDVDQAVAVRMQRQQALYDPAKRFHFILSEAVLHSRLCPDGVFAGQLDRLIALSSLGNVRLGILPFTARLPLAPLNGFWIFDDGLVTFETIAAELHIRDPEQIALYVRAFEQFAAAAIDGSDVRRILGSRQESLRTS